MPNRNYLRGTAFEREIIKERQLLGEVALRTAGSHGFADVVSIVPGQLVDFIQCKVTISQAVANRLCKSFQANPPLPPGPYRQILVVKIPRVGRKTVIIERTG